MTRPADRNPSSRKMAPHVQAAIGASQAKMASPAKSPRPVAPHVQASLRHAVAKPVQMSSKDLRRQKYNQKHGSSSHGQLPGKLSKLPTGKPKNRASRFLHDWKKSRGMKGASVHGSERQEMEAYIIQKMVAENYVQDLISAGYTAQDMIQAGCSMLDLLYGGLEPGDLGYETFHEAFA